MADLYIRSSDGWTLTKVKTLSIEQSGEYYSVFGDTKDYPLGCYKTSERAKEILGEIQKLLIQPTAFLKADIPQDFSYEDANKYVDHIDDFCKQCDFIYVGAKDIEITPTNNTNIVFTMPKE